MKPSSLLVALCLSVLCFSSQAQSTFENDALIPRSSLFNRGVGFGSNFLSNPVNSNRKYFDVQLGGDFFFSSLNATTLKGIPLPQDTVTANIRLSNKIFGMDGMARFVYTKNQKIMPYIDVFTGMRSISCGMDVTPNSLAMKSSHENIYHANELAYGGALGLRISLNDYIKLNMRFCYSYAQCPGQMPDLSTSHYDNGSIVMDKLPSTKGVCMFNVGLTFMIHGGYADNQYYTGPADGLPEILPTPQGSGSGSGSSGGRGHSSHSSGHSSGGGRGYSMPSVRFGSGSGGGGHIGGRVR